jgi:hypothetical protein
MSEILGKWRAKNSNTHVDNQAHSVEVDEDVKEQTDTVERERESGRRLLNCKFWKENLVLKSCDIYWRTTWQVQLITAHQKDVDACLLVRTLTGSSSYRRPYFIGSTWVK